MSTQNTNQPKETTTHLPIVITTKQLRYQARRFIMVISDTVDNFIHATEIPVSRLRLRGGLTTYQLKVN